MSDSHHTLSPLKTEYDAVVVGAGFAGMYMLHKLRAQGLSVRVFERGSGVGGTWFWNRYPGARCDVESLEYSYQFSEDLQQEWHWPERYSAQPEILEYANHVADRFDLRSDIQFNTRVSAALFDEESGRWSVDTDAGDRISAKFVIMATGCLSSTNVPDFKGLDSFSGPIYHTGDWPHEKIDFSGKRVGIIGTGSSAIQAIPIIAEEADYLTVFQRTANYSVPSNNGPLDPNEEQRVKADYAGFRQRNAQMPSGAGADSGRNRANGSALDATPDAREKAFANAWDAGAFTIVGAYEDLMINAQANETIAEFARSKIREIVNDPETAELLCPQQTFGCKRLCVDTDYFETYNRSNVKLVDISQCGIGEITSNGLLAGDERYDFDCLILATGYDAMTGALLNVDIRGKGGQTLGEKWAAGPRTYLGLGTAGFPNLFTITGPGSPSVLTNMLPTIEQHVNWVSDLIAYMNEHGQACVEAELDAENAWVDHVNEIASYTLYPTCNSWYLGANVEGKPRVFMPHVGFPPYVEKCNQVAANGYEGFALSA